MEVRHAQTLVVMEVMEALEVLVVQEALEHLELMEELELNYQQHLEIQFQQ